MFSKKFLHALSESWFEWFWSVYPSLNAFLEQANSSDCLLMIGISFHLSLAPDHGTRSVRRGKKRLHRSDLLPPTPPILSGSRPQSGVSYFHQAHSAAQQRWGQVSSSRQSSVSWQDRDPATCLLHRRRLQQWPTLHLLPDDDQLAIPAAHSSHWNCRWPQGQKSPESCGGEIHHNCFGSRVRIPDSGTG